MILGIGSDLTDIRRITQSLEKYEDRFENRVFAEIEQTRARAQQSPAAAYAKRFAAKEACAKALGVGIRGLSGLKNMKNAEKEENASAENNPRAVSFKDILVENELNGRPVLKLSGEAEARLHDMTPAGMKPEVHISLSDEGDYAMAFVILSAAQASN
jgi:holo-[acyl-carrier protein] synthase